MVVVPYWGLQILWIEITAIVNYRKLQCHYSNDYWAHSEAHFNFCWSKSFRAYFNDDFHSFWLAHNFVNFSLELLCKFMWCWTIKLIEICWSENFVYFHSTSMHLTGKYYKLVWNVMKEKSKLVLKIKK